MLSILIGNTFNVKEKEVMKPKVKVIETKTQTDNGTNENKKVPDEIKNDEYLVNDISNELNLL